jgi:anti-anti-sigma regulatory factor
MANISKPASSLSAGGGRYTITEGPEHELVFRIEGRFDFELARALLLETRERCRDGATKIIVEMVGVTHLYSSGIGWLIILCDLAKPGHYSIRLRDCSPRVTKFFELGVFDSYLGPSVVSYSTS